ncbi:MAG: hypothetical protein JW901_00955 [Dehalococcoidia bacterium]|nr:hypothetical protein [Dehalococcoidia bacterium]
MKTGLMGYFSNAPAASTGKKVLLIILGITLFVSLVLLGPIMALQQTVFNPDCVASYVNDIDVPAMTHSWLMENVAPRNPALAKSVELVVINFEPQIKEIMRSCVRSIYAYILDSLKKGKLLDTVTAQKPLVDDLTAHIQALMDLPILSPVFQMLGINAESVTKYIDISQINSLFDMLEQLAEIESLAVILMSGLVPLLLLVIALLAAIVLIARRPGFILGELGLISAISGIMQCIIILPAGNMVKSLISQFNLPSLIIDWMLRLVQDFSCIIMIYGGALLLAGVVLILIHSTMRRTGQ